MENSSLYEKGKLLLENSSFIKKHHKEKIVNRDAYID